ncbi:hypothetical protein [Caulobacter sp. RHG1]|uniref:hypothetical protein n=1 Tax=Caulobacter sp. (strain RHG1) TaxID=2545762 RepID=UPI001556A9E0|nr:hypothetical protein [Caulobacter sp. RHG1]NQE60408.1 hypothetical protein [Caulobacter sp. RHG1]
MRAALLLSACFLGLGAVAQAQDLRDSRDPLVAHALQDAQRAQSAREIEASNAQDRARTAVVLRELDAQRAGAPTLRPLTDPSTARMNQDLAQHYAERARSVDQLERLTQDALDESNARIRAIKPASEPN